MKKQYKILLGTVFGVLLALLGGAMINFFPFVGDDLVVREIQFCSFVVCVVIALCTGTIVKTMEEKPGGENRVTEKDLAEMESKEDKFA